MANVNQRIIDEYNQAQTLDALQRARRQMGAEIAAQDPAYFQPNIADAGQPMYSLDQRINDIYTGSNILASDNRVTGKVARTLNDMGVPLAAIEPAMGLLQFTPVGTAEGLYDSYTAAPEVVRNIREGEYGRAAGNAATVGLGLLDAGMSALPIAKPVVNAARGVNTRGLTSDAMYAGRSLLEGDLGGVRDAFTPSRAPRGLGADAPKIDVLGSGYGQTDMRLTLPNVEGQIDYSVFEGRPKINMVEVPENARRQGNATKLLQALQEQFPDTEIDWGSLTTDGSSLFKSTNFSEIPSAYAGDFARLDAAKSRFAAMQSDFAGMQARNQSPPAGFFDEWNDLQDEIYNLSSELEFKSPVERIISANRDATAGAIALPAARTEAEAMARQILEMRAAGRAGDVTDAMMAQADPQYMFNNTPLPMDEASRMARAGEMGLLDPQYHATQSDFQSFMPSETGLTGRGVYTGDEAVDVMDYARSRMSSNEGLNVIPLLSPEGSTYARKLDWERTLDADPELPYNATWEQNVEGMRRAADTMSAQGYPGVHSQPGERVTFNPQSLRSRFARFDPAFKHLANLSAATVPAGILAMPNKEERNRQLGLLFGGY
jgi:hypothetical protein